MEKPTANQYPIHDLLRQRWSPRAYAPRPVENEKLLSLFEAARWSPSGGNAQPWAFVVTRRADFDMDPAGEPFAQFASSVLYSGNQDWARHAPVLVLAVVKLERQDGRPNAWALYDLGQAVANLTVQATALGLSLRQMGGFDAQKARELFDIPEGYAPVTAIAIGYAGNLDGLPEELRQREMAARSRKPLADFVFEGHWNDPLSLLLEEQLDLSC